MGMMGHSKGAGAGILADVLGQSASSKLAAQTPNSRLASALFGGLSQADARKAAAWAKARPVGSSLNALLSGDFRIDDFGNLIRWRDYGDHMSKYGWEIDHAQPSILGGSDHHSNLRALHCSTNRSLGGALGNALNRNPISR